MCGFSGCYFLEKNCVKNKFNSINLHHRGPDDFQIFRNDFLKVNFYRLKILGGSYGKQPMLSENKRWMLLFNGEIYNYIEIAKEMGRSDLIKKGDTRVLLELLASEGVNAIKKTNGMFSIVLADLKKKKIFLIRDRFGTKPLYYSIQKRIIYFASEIKSLPIEKNTEVNFNKINNYLKSELYPAAPNTFFSNVFEIKPGTINEFEKNKIKSKKYYSLEKKLIELDNKNLSLSDFEKALEKSIMLRLRSDVPISLHFSGGVDSTAILCKLKEMFGEKIPIKVYFLKYKKKDDFDLRRAKKICKILNQKLIVINFKENKIFSLAQKTQYFMDEPFGGIPTLGMSQLNKIQKKKIPVSLEGQGSDEILSGYFTHVLMALKDMKKKKEEQSIYLKVRNNFKLTDKKIINLSNLLYKNNFGGSTDGSKISPSRIKIKKQNNNLRTIEYFNIKHNKLPRVLRFHDRISAGYSRELRFPFLDHNVVEISLSLKNKYKFGNGFPKYPLINIISRHLPANIFKEKKRSNSVPEFQILLKNKKKIFKIFKYLRNLKKIKDIYFLNAEKKLMSKKNSNSFHIWQIINIYLFLKHFEFLKKRSLSKF